MEVKIRKLVAEDAPVIMQMVAEFDVYLQSIDSEFSKEKYLRDGFGDAPMFQGYIAEDADGKALGYVIIYLGYSVEKGKSIAHIADIFVREHARGQGVGYMLFNAVKSSVKTLGGYAIFWSVWTKNEPAKRAYKSWGAQFTEDGVDQKEMVYLL